MCEVKRQPNLIRAESRSELMMSSCCKNVRARDHFPDIHETCRRDSILGQPHPVAYPGIFFGGGSTNSVEDRGQREQGSGGSSPQVRGSGGSCNLVQ